MSVFGEFSWYIFSLIWTEYGDLRIRFKWGEVRTRKTRNKDFFCAVHSTDVLRIDTCGCIVCWYYKGPELHESITKFDKKLNENKQKMSVKNIDFFWQKQYYCSPAVLLLLIKNIVRWKKFNISKNFIMPCTQDLHFRQMWKMSF